MVMTFDEWINESEENKKSFFIDSFILQITEHIYSCFYSSGISKKELRKRLKISKKRLNNFLNTGKEDLEFLGNLLYYVDPSLSILSH
jgi:hypothetical protein